MAKAAVISYRSRETGAQQLGIQLGGGTAVASTLR